MSTLPAAEPAARYRYLTDSYVFRWENQTLRADLILTLPIAVCLILGIAVGVQLVGAGATAAITELETRQKPLRLVDERA